ncbi:hypothetical protein KR044_013473, partial [Drosophila immigrans]
HTSNNMARALVPLLILFVAAISQASVVRQFPPLQRRQRLENPNQRFQTRADEETYRLPNNTEPISYDVVLSTHVHLGETGFNGTVIINLEVTETSSIIVVHARQLSNFTASIKQAGQGTEIQLQYSQDEDREFLKFFATDVTFTKGTTWLLTINYQGNLRTDNGGFYLSTYTDEQGATKYLATTQFESTDARHAFPCYDEPAKRANFTITIHHDPSYNALSNMPVNEEKTSSGITSFNTTVKMSSYLVAFIVSDLVSSEGKLNNLPQRVFSRKGTEHEQEWALTTGMLVEKRLSGYFDVPFTLPKLDQAAIPDFAAGAMENWGLATYREEYLLYNTENSTVNTQTDIAVTEAHEDAHMWFGDLVAIEFWSYLWLKEGFATLFQSLAVDLAYPEWDIFQTFHVDSYEYALITDADPDIRPMTYFVEKPSDISMLYDDIAYDKAGCVLDMWRNALTNTVFQRGLHNYLDANKFSAANETHLFMAIALASREENFAVAATIEEMLSSWTRQGGVPLLTVTRNYDQGTFTVKQEQYTNNKTYESSKLWYVPINYALESNPDFRNTAASHYLLKETETTITDAQSTNDNWLIPNKQSTGYYRVNYDDTNWQLISDGLSSRPHKIHPRNRAQIISDLYRFVTSGRVSHARLLQLLTYLPKEDQYAPWSAANTVITLFNHYLSGNEHYANFLFYVTELVSEQYDKFGVNDVHGEQHLAKYTRNVVINVACLAGVQSCLSETKAKLEALVDAGTKIEANLQTPVYCNGLKQADDKTFNFVFEKLMNSNDQAERSLLISVLGCALSQSQLQKYVASSIDQTNKLRSQERYMILNSAYSRGEIGLLVAIEFLLANWETYGNLNAGFGGINPLYSDIMSMSAFVVNDSQKAKLEELVDAVKGSEFVPDTLQTSVDANINANQEWLSANREPIISWVNTFCNGSPAMSASILAIALCLLAAKFF